jgi:hypothetical protein
MSEVAVQQPQATALSVKIQYAQAMAQSSLLPRQYQKQPANLLFALEYADALGVSPIHAITSIHVIEGKPSASADLIASLVRKAGHKLRVTGDATTCTAILIRQDDPDFEFTATWTMAQATKANLTGKSVWKQYPSAMLRARAITEVCRMGAPDALYGVIYTPEELGANVDADGAPVDLGEHPTPTPAPEPAPELKPKQTRSRKPVTPIEPPADLPAPADDEPAEIVDEPAVELITEPQSKMMFALLAQNGFTDDGTSAQKDYLESIIGRQLTSRRDITKVEATKIIDLLNDAAADAA